MTGCARIAAVADTHLRRQAASRFRPLYLRGEAYDDSRTWDEFRQKCFVDGQPTSVRKRPETFVTPPGWVVMNEEPGLVRRAIRDELLDTLAEAFPGSTVAANDDGPASRIGPASTRVTEARPESDRG